MEPKVDSGQRRNSDMHDFSISSLISDLSKLIGDRADSSFLVSYRKDDCQMENKKNSSEEPSEIRQSENEGSKLLSSEIGKIPQRSTSSDALRRDSTRRSLRGRKEPEGNARNSNVTCGASALPGNKLGYSNQELEVGRLEELDSWDEFDKIMEKSLLPKELEQQEFEALASYSNLACPTDSKMLETFNVTEFQDGKSIIDKDEEERLQFLQSANASLPSLCATPSFQVGPMSITDYFKGRSSFPLEFQANESTMMQTFQSRSQNENTPVNSKRNEEKSSDLTITEVPYATFESSDYVSNLPSSSTPAVAKQLDDKTRLLAKFLLGNKSDGICKDELMKYVVDVCADTSLRDSKLKEKLDVLRENYAEKPGRVVTFDDSNFENGEKQTFSSLKSAQKLAERLKNSSSEPTTTEIVDEKSVLISEPVKTCFDKDFQIADFDEFKRRLVNSQNGSNLASSAAKDSFSVGNNIVWASGLRETGDGVLSKGHLMTPRTDSSSTRKNLSPPVKLNDKFETMQSHSSTSLRNHSTPISHEPLSSQLAKSIRAQNDFELNASKKSESEQKSGPSEKSFDSLSTVVTRRPIGSQIKTITTQATCAEQTNGTNKNYNESRRQTGERRDQLSPIKEISIVDQCTTSISRQARSVSTNSTYTVDNNNGTSQFTNHPFTYNYGLPSQFPDHLSHGQNIGFPLNIHIHLPTYPSFPVHCGAPLGHGCPGTDMYCRRNNRNNNCRCGEKEPTSDKTSQ